MTANDKEKELEHQFLSERSSNSVSVVRVIDQLFKCFEALDWFSDTHLSDFFHSYNLWFKDFQHNF